MTLLDLLDKIDETAPRTCQTCKHMATHAKCDGCLNTPADYAAYRDGKPMPDMRYLNWEPGNWLREEHAAQLSGARNIVIGGQGEAEVNVKRTPQQAAKHLHYVAGECGYSVGPLRHKLEFHVKYGAEVAESRIAICTSEGEFELLWIEGQLESIRDVNHPNGWKWSRVLEQMA